MIFWIDAQLSPALAPWLTETFEVEAYSVKFLGYRDAADKVIFEAARAVKDVVIIKDADFVTMLEQVASPGDVIQALAGFVTPAGKLSLMFLNHNSRVLKRILGGDFTSYSSPKNTQETLQQPAPKTFSEAKGLHEEHVRHLLADYGFVVQSKAGIRIFHDHIPEHLRELDLPALLELEKNYRATEPFASLAQHIHLICQRTTSDIVLGPGGVGYGDSL